MTKIKQFDSKFSKEPFRKSRAANRILTKKSGKVPENSREGIVYLAVGKNFEVKDSESGEFIDCILGGTVITPYENINVAAVGDKVTYIPEEKDESKGTILKIEERSSKLSRQSVKKTDNEQIIAANIDQILIFMSADEPLYNKRLIDRYLITCRMYEIPAIICINKIDIFDMDFLNEDLQTYMELGYPVHFISLVTKENLEELMKELEKKTTLITGPSGTGKSTFINFVLNEDVQKIGKVSEKTTKGKHTTSFVQMFDIRSGGKLIDTPGIREFGIWNIDKNELQMFFSDFDDYRENCKFIPCSHTHEPKCAVKEAVENGEIDPERYNSYAALYESL